MHVCFYSSTHISTSTRKCKNSYVLFFTSVSLLLTTHVHRESCTLALYSALRTELRERASTMLCAVQVESLQNPLSYF